MKKSSRDLLSEFRSLVPERRPVRIQRWSWRRTGLTFGTLFGLFVVVVLVLSNLHGAGLL